MGPKIDEDVSIDALKDLLIKPEKEQIQKIQARLDDPMVRAKELSRFLPEAISLSILDNNKISRVISPVIDETIKTSVKNNPKVMADAIFPALGPGIRKAITSTLMGMIQSLNQVLNHSFSIQGLKWRFEALRTGKPFAEVVLLHTLVYKVEQIFMIHRNSGIVLDHVVAKDVIIQDPDLVSGMLTAIQDFVSDSFQSDTNDELETLRIGADTSVWIEQGKDAFIAAVIRGTPPLSLRTQFKELIEDIHIKSGSSMENFDGDPLPFSIFRDQLTDGLQSRAKDQAKKTSPLVWVMVLVVLFLTGVWGVNAYKTRTIWNAYLGRLDSQNGLIVVSASKQSGHHKIFGLKDPLEKEPLSFITDKDKTRLNLISLWKPFISLDPEFVLARAIKRLAPPPTINMTINHTTLILRGSAPQNWIVHVKKEASTIEGIDALNTEHLKNTDQETLNAALNKLSKIKIYFENNSTTLIPGQEDSLDRISGLLATIGQLAHLLNDPVKIAILGHTDSSGSEKFNLELSRKRAQTMLEQLTLSGLDSSLLTIQGVGTKMPLKKETKIEDRQYNRAISFKILTKGT